MHLTNGGNDAERADPTHSRLAAGEPVRFEIGHAERRRPHGRRRWHLMLAWATTEAGDLDRFRPVTFRL